MNTNLFVIYLKNGNKYIMQIGFNFQKYKIKKGYLYEGLKKLGEIVAVEGIGR